jgi:DNA polymerase-3 subunit gamma/tau
MTNQLSISRRPRKFSEIVGQQRTINEMYKRSNENNFPQAMMFQGSTGTGKTTMGFIVASLINCSNPIEENGNKEPCGECASCKSVATESFSRSIHLYDGAKLNKEGITKLEDVANNSSLYPNEKNIIIIEEAQEIKSEGAKGALLKLLEKPRKNVHFILLTMDEKKFDTSVKDRCQVYIFKKLKDSEVSDYIFSLLEEYDPDEKFPVTFIEEVIPVIIDNASGSLRKAIEDFERCIFSEIYTAKIAIEELGYMDEKTMYETIVLMANKD